MSYYLSPSPMLQFFDNDGAELSGGLLFTYANNTNTKQTTYVDALGVAPNTNPIKLNARGECSIFLPPGQTFTYVLSPSTDTDPPTNPVWVQNNIVAGGAVATINFGTDTGVLNASTASISGITGYFQGLALTLAVAVTNTGPATLNVNGLGAVPIERQDGTQLIGGELQANGQYLLQYSGSAFQILGLSIPNENITASELAANVTPTNFYYPEGNVLRYGADPTGVTLSDTAILAAIAVMAQGSTNSGGVGGLGSHTPVYFPSGQYNYSTNSIFSNPIYPTTIRGPVFIGDGPGCSVLMLVTGGSTKWHWDGSVGTTNETTAPYTQSYLFPTFEKLCFMTDNATFGNGFKSLSSQGGRFKNCYFTGLGIVFNAVTPYVNTITPNLGYLGDSWTWEGCKATGCRQCFVFGNSQAFNFASTNSQWEGITGNLVTVGAGGGGGITFEGGSLICNDVSLHSGTQTFLVSIVSGANLSDSNNWYTFRDCAISIQSTFAGTCGLVNNLGNTGQYASQILFEKCSIQQIANGQQTVTNYQGRVTFDKCALTLLNASTYVAIGPNAGGAQYGDPGTIVFYTCDVPPNFSSFCSTPVGGDGLSWGLISARNCFFSGLNDLGASSSARNLRFAVDFDLNWQNQGRYGNVPILKRASLMTQNYPWPCASGSFTTWNLTLPVGAVVVRIIIYRPPTGSNIAYALQCGTQANATYYSALGAVTGANCNTVSTVVYDNSLNAIGPWTPVTSANNQVVLTGVGAGVTNAEVGNGGYAIVEYY